MSIGWQDECAKQVFSYDRDQVTWKISNSSHFLRSDAAHPLDAEVDGQADFVVVDITDFDGVFEGAMPKAAGAKKRRKREKPKQKRSLNR